jgi:hypothetical protein
VLRIRISKIREMTIRARIHRKRTLLQAREKSEIPAQRLLTAMKAQCALLPCRTDTALSKDASQVHALQEANVFSSTAETHTASRHAPHHQNAGKMKAMYAILIIPAGHPSRQETVLSAEHAEATQTARIPVLTVILRNIKENQQDSPTAIAYFSDAKQAHARKVLTASR